MSTTFRLTEDQKIKAHLGFAAMLNSTMVDARLDRDWGTDPKRKLRNEIEEYFAVIPIESFQFVKGEMLDLLDEYTNTGVIQMLRHIGKDPFASELDPDVIVDGVWEAAIAELLDGDLPKCEMNT
jgi:hypothetical protein